MGAGFFFARPRRKAGLSMGGENDGAAAQAQVEGQQAEANDQVTYNFLRTLTAG